MPDSSLADRGAAVDPARPEALDRQGQEGREGRDQRLVERTLAQRRHSRRHAAGRELRRPAMAAGVILLVITGKGNYQ